jgi:hypothetical protein
MSREASMSEADAFRKSNKEFWSKMEQKGNAQRGHRFEGEKARQAPIKFSRAVLRAPRRRCPLFSANGFCDRPIPLTRVTES